MDDSSKKIVMIIAGASLATMAVMAFRYYNQPPPEAPVATEAPEPAPPKAVQVAAPSPAPPSPPANAVPTIEQIPAINGAPSMVLDNNDGNQSSKDAPAPTNNIQ